jgi:hypothetical protein
MYLNLTPANCKFAWIGIGLSQDFYLQRTTQQRTLLTYNHSPSGIKVEQYEFNSQPRVTMGILRPINTGLLKYVNMHEGTV